MKYPLATSTWDDKELNAIQISNRPGKLQCENKKNRVIIGGKAKTYSIGHLWTE